MEESGTRKRRVLIGTPAYDGRLDAYYVSSLLQTMKLVGDSLDLEYFFLPREAIIQCARNEIIAYALRNNFDDLIFIDSDIQWKPEWVLSLLARKEHVVGGTARKKTDIQEMYCVTTSNFVPAETGLIAVDSMGTAFVRISREALLAVWNRSTEYRSPIGVVRMICEVIAKNGKFLSEDTVLFKKLAALGYPAWLDPSMTCAHIGWKKYEGDVGAHMQKALGVVSAMPADVNSANGQQIAP